MILLLSELLICLHGQKKSTHTTKTKLNKRGEWIWTLASHLGTCEYSARPRSQLAPSYYNMSRPSANHPVYVRQGGGDWTVERSRTLLLNRRRGDRWLKRVRFPKPWWTRDHSRTGQAIFYHTESIPTSDDYTDTTLITSIDTANSVANNSLLHNVSFATIHCQSYPTVFGNRVVVSFRPSLGKSRRVWCERKDGPINYLINKCSVR